MQCGLTPCVQSARDPGLHCTQAFLQQLYLFHCVSSFPPLILPAFPNRTTYPSGFFFLVGFQMKFLPEIFKETHAGEEKKSNSQEKSIFIVRSIFFSILLVAFLIA